MDIYKSQSPEISSTSPREPEQDEEEEEEDDDKPHFWDQDDDDSEVLDLTGGAGDFSHPPFTVSFPAQPRAADQLPKPQEKEKPLERSLQPAPDEPSIKLPERSPQPSMKPLVPSSTITEDPAEPAPPTLPRRRGPSGSADETLFALPAASAPLHLSAEKVLDLQDQPCVSPGQEDIPSVLLETAASLPSLSSSLSAEPFKEHTFSDGSPPELLVEGRERVPLTKMDLGSATNAETLFGIKDDRRTVGMGVSEMESQFILPSELEASIIDDVKDEMETPEERETLDKIPVCKQSPEVHSPHLVYYARETFTERIKSDGCPEYAFQGAFKEESPLREDYVDFKAFETIKVAGHESSESDTVNVDSLNIVNQNIRLSRKTMVQKDYEDDEFGQDNIDISSRASEALQNIPEIYNTATFETLAAYDSMSQPVPTAVCQASETKTDGNGAEIEVLSDSSITTASLLIGSVSHKLDSVTTDNLPVSLMTSVTSMSDALTPDLVQEACESEMYDSTCTKPYEAKIDLVQMTSELLQEPLSPVIQLSSFEGCDALSSPVLPDIVMEAPLGSGTTSTESTNVQPDTSPLEEIVAPLVSEEKIKLKSEKPPSYEEAVKVSSHVHEEIDERKLKIIEDIKDAALEDMETPYISIACDLIKETKISDVCVPPAFLGSKAVTKDFTSQPESELTHELEMSFESEEADSVDTPLLPKVASKDIDMLGNNMRESPVEPFSTSSIDYESKDIVNLPSPSRNTFQPNESPSTKPKEEKHLQMEGLCKVAVVLSDTKDSKSEDDKEASKLVPVTKDLRTSLVSYKVELPSKPGQRVADQTKSGEDQMTDIKQLPSLETPHDLSPSVKTSAAVRKSASTDKVPEVCGSTKEMLDSTKPPVLSEKVIEVSSSKVKHDKERETSVAASSLSGMLSKASVVDLLYWRDIKKTGVVFGATLFLLLSLTVFSIVSVLAYIALALLSLSISFRIYRGVLQAVQKSDEGHPFRAYLDSDIGVSEEFVQKYSNVALGHINCTVKELRRLFLVEDLVDSLKFAVLMWILTYVGALFNGLTLMILALISLFSIPVIYERHQAQIDHYLELVNKNFKNGIAKIQAKIPGLKRKAE